MSDYVITTDNTADLPEEYVRKYQLGMMSLTYTIEEKPTTGNMGCPVRNFMPE